MLVSSEKSPFLPCLKYVHTGADGDLIEAKVASGLEYFSFVCFCFFHTSPHYLARTANVHMMCVPPAARQ